MSNRHCIESAELNISYSSEELALSQHGELEEFAKSELFEIVNEVFDGISDTETVFWFEKIEVDLGDISLTHFYEDFGARLKDKIRECLNDELRMHRAVGNPNHEQTTTRRSDFDILTQFLISGRAPWNANFTKQNTAEVLLERVIDTHGKELIAFIRAADKRSQILTRLCAQFPESLLSELLALVVDLRSDELRDLIDRLLTLGATHLGMNRADVYSRVWAELFQRAFLNRSRNLSDKEVVACITEAISLSVSHRYPLLLERLVQHARGDRGNARLLELIRAVSSEANGGVNQEDKLQDLFSSQDALIHTSDLEEQNSRIQSLAVRARLVEAVNKGSIVKLKPVWLTLRKKHSFILKDVVTSLGQSAQVRRNIARHFQESMIEDIVELLEPVNYKFIETVVNEPKLYRRAKDKLEMPESNARQSLWEFTLTYILVERGSQFNKKSYIASMMSKMAANQNVSVSQLCQSIMVMLAPVTRSDPLRNEILQFLSEIGGKAARRLEASEKNMPDGHSDASGNFSSDPSSGLSNEADSVSSRLPEVDSVTTKLSKPPSGAAEALSLAFAGTDLSELKLVWKLLLKDHRGWLTSVFESAAQRESVRRNISNLFTNLMFKELIYLIEPAHGEFICEVVNRSSTEIISKGEAPQKVKRVVRELTLTYLLVDRGARFNKKSYLANLLKRMAAHEDASSNFSIDPSIGLLGEADSVSSRLPEVDSATTKLSKPPSGAAEALSLAFAGTDLSELKLVWKLLLKDHRGWLTSVFESAAQRESVRRNISKSFTNLMFKELIYLVEPVHGEFICEVVHRSSTKITSKGKRIEAPQKVKRVVREFTLTYLLVDRGTRFNKKSYLANLLKRMAAHENVSVLSIYRSIRESFQSVAFMRSLQKEILPLLNEVATELRIQSDTPESRPKPGIELVSQGFTDDNKLNLGNQRQSEESAKEFEQLELIRAYLLYEKLSGAIAVEANSVGNISYHVVRLIHELIEHYPWILHRFNQEVNEGQLQLSSIIGRLPKALQRRLLLSFFSSMASKYQFESAQFAKKLEMIEQDGIFDLRIYGAVLDRLIGNRIAGLEDLFDMDEFALSEPVTSPKLTMINQSHGQQEGISTQVGLQESAPLLFNKGTTDLIRALLLGHLNLAEKDRVSIISTLELMLSSHPSALSQLLKESLTDIAASGRLVAILPESLLVKLILLLRPDDHFKVILYADLMTMAAVEAGKTASTMSAMFHLAKWQYIFNYMIIEGRRFHEVSFVRDYSNYLLKRSMFKDYGQFAEQLSKSISISSSTVTHVTGVRISMILGGSAKSGNAISENKQSLSNGSSQGNTKLSALKSESLGAEGSVEKKVIEALSTNAFNEDLDDGIKEDIYIDNAGLVLLSPYFPRYFEMLGLLEGNKFRDRAAAERGVHLLQYLLNGSTDSFEYQLLLNKLLCGVEAGLPIVRSIEITKQEEEAALSLLQGVIGNWPSLKNTTVDGLRETFLQREAHLQLKGDSWRLLVQSKSFDLLLDSIPWSFSTIRLAWMKRPIHVDWRE